MIEVSEQFADNINGQYGFDTKLDSGRQHSNKRMHRRFRPTVFTMVAFFLDLGDAGRNF